MTNRFDYFVVFAEMRTGSNFLEANINSFEGMTCYGEAFNPHFIGYPNKDNILGVSLTTRDENPFSVIDAIKDEPNSLGGFRFFHDHDLRILDDVLADPRCAKIILTRNPMDSYVSWKIAQATGQWKLTDVRKRKDSKVEFDGAEFTQHVAKLQAFQIHLLNTLQRSGQTAFYVAYEDLQDLGVMNGLAKYLGVDETLDALDAKLKRQNPSHISEKVENFDAVPAAISALDQFNLNRTPNFEPRRGPAVPTYVAGADTGLIYLPIQGGPSQTVTQWMADIDNASVRDLATGLNQKEFRQWRRAHMPHRSFSVVRHPVARAHYAFCKMILSSDKGAYHKIRRTLRNRFSLPIPEAMPDQAYDAAAHRVAFKEYLRFIKANLAGQTAIRQDAYWSSQASIIGGFGVLAFPDAILREDELATDLVALAAKVGVDAPAPQPVDEGLPYTLAAIYDDEIESLTRDAYQRDYVTFGFQNWE